MTKPIHIRRMEAAIASGGISADPVYRLVLEVIESQNVRGRILDFGAGTGTLSAKLCSMDAISEVAAIDIVPYSPSHRHDKLKWSYCDLNKELPIEDAAFDAIVSVEVIEHLENPRSLAREWFRLLRPGGLLIVTTPNNESWRSIVSLLMRGHFNAFSDSSYPAHITALLRADLKRLLMEAGFCDCQIQFANHGAVPQLTRLTWQSVSFGLLKGLRFSDNLLVKAEKPLLARP